MKMKENSNEKTQQPIEGLETLLRIKRRVKR